MTPHPPIGTITEIDLAHLRNIDGLELVRRQRLRRLWHCGLLAAGHVHLPKLLLPCLRLQQVC
jgi:hypothetical protein